MKKICVLTLGLIASASISAQVAVVKDGEKAVKGADTYPALVEAIKVLEPAFTDPETSKDSKTFWIPGKQGFRLYDDMLVKVQLGQQVAPLEMAGALLDGYHYGYKALDVDTVVDAKGKVKTKLSKEITSQIAGHLNDYINAGSYFWDAQKYPEAYECFTAYLETPMNPRLGSLAPKMPADSMRAQIEYYRGLAAWQGEMLPQAADAFEKMMELGYPDMQAYDYAYSVAYQLGDEAKKLKYSQIAYDKFGSAKPDFFQRIIQSYITAKDYPTAISKLEEVIAADPTNANYPYLLGVLYDDQGEKEKAMELFKKAYELDPSGAMYNFSYGTALLQKAERLDENTKDMSQAEYNKFRAETMNPMLKEAASYLEKAYELDPDNMHNALTNLKIIYYNLNDGENLKRIENLLL
ncbi:MAG: tetratricopeptide repeat protein [Muribaculaceae bacterium]|nr:tetratricopeptide repeat protein [Muribaculaceae bacterium]